MDEINATSRDGRPVSLRFAKAEYDARLARARASLRREGLDALLVFAPESHYYLTGYDSAGYVFFQCGVITADDSDPTILLTRRPDRAQARDASLYDDIRIWYNAEGVNPAAELKDILAALKLGGARIGIELATYGLTGANYELVRQTLGGWCTLSDASHLVRTLRLIKSPAEIAFVRHSARLADAAIEAMVAATRPGVLDSAVTAAGVAAMLEGGGDMPAGGPLVNSGRRAIYGRGIGGARRLEPDDQMMLELGASYGRYNVCIEHTVILGAEKPRQRFMFDTAKAALQEITEAARPGRPIGELDEVHRRVLDGAGFAQHRFAACGYSLGATFRPTWMDVPPMIYSGNPLALQPGMVLFPHVMLGDAETSLAAGVGYTVLITDAGAEVLSQLPLVLHAR